MKAQDLYFRLPNYVQNGAVSFKGYLNKLRRKTGSFHDIYCDLMSNMELKEEELKNLQLVILKDLLLELYQYSDYYHDLMNASNISLKDVERAVSPYEILSKFPLMEKAVLRNNLRQIVSMNPQRKSIGVGHTSGTTGTPLIYEVDKYSRKRTFAEWERYYRWMGLPNRFKSIRFSGRLLVAPDQEAPPFWVYNLAERQLLMSTYHLKKENFRAYVDKIETFKPDLIDGYPSAINIIAQYINRTETKMQHHVRAISTTAETLSDDQRSEIECAFGCKVYNQYASSEGAPWIVECSCGNMHLWTDTGVFEFINPMETEDGTRYEMVVTSFRNWKTPLVRYRIGDYVILNEDGINCECGSPFPCVDKVIGREDDMMYTTEKGYVGRLTPAIKECGNIIRAQLTETNIDKFILKLIVDEGYSSETEEKLLNALKARLGHNVDIDIYLVDHIPVGANGKYKAYINNLDIKILGI